MVFLRLISCLFNGWFSSFSSCTWVLFLLCLPPGDVPEPETEAFKTSVNILIGKMEGTLSVVFRRTVHDRLLEFSRPMGFGGSDDVEAGERNIWMVWFFVFKGVEDWPGAVFFGSSLGASLTDWLHSMVTVISANLADNEIGAKVFWNQNASCDRIKDYRNGDPELLERPSRSGHGRTRYTRTLGAFCAPRPCSHLISSQPRFDWTGTTCRRWLLLCARWERRGIVVPGPRGIWKATRRYFHRRGNSRRDSDPSSDSKNCWRAPCTWALKTTVTFLTPLLCQKSYEACRTSPWWGRTGRCTRPCSWRIASDRSGSRWGPCTLNKEKSILYTCLHGKGTRRIFQFSTVGNDFPRIGVLFR